MGERQVKSRERVAQHGDSNATTNFFERVLAILRQDSRFVAKDGTFLRNAVYEAAMQMDKLLIQLLLDNQETCQRFFVDVDGIKVFDKTAFAWVINNRQFLPDSYTRFKNKIGLAEENGEQMSTSGKVELVFPYKDCILEGGQIKEDQKRQEIFYNETLAPDEVDRLLYPKVLVNAKRFSYGSNYDLTGQPTGEGSVRCKTVTEFADTDNLIIKGNNLLALTSLIKRYEGKIRLIYIDPPYNTGNDSFNYNDSFNHSSWLLFMKNRLEIAKRLLADNGSIYIQLDYNEVHYCKVLMDEIFGIDCFQREIIWDTQVLSGYKTMVNNWVRGHDSILFYTKRPSGFLFNKLKRPQTQEYLDSFNKVDENGRHYMIAHGTKRYRDEAEERGRVFGDVWNDIKSFMQMPTASERIDFSTQKPEAILERIILSATNEGDIVLDFFGGSGTTGAVAHKLKRKYIMCEQIDSQAEIMLERLRKVVSGDDKGTLALSLNWQGGGAFVYCELAKLNQSIVEEIETATTDESLSDIYYRMMKSGFISYKVDPKAICDAADDYTVLSLNEKKQFLMELLDKNLLYVNLCDIDDKEFGISESDKAFTRSFYQEEV
ncbi:MAG: site-specific DNA-methyltransferase [Proteobacteria bacterium]|nr:site-specific DNA-methyltransferase [Pseudomonadota bacterium]